MARVPRPAVGTGSVAGLNAVDAYNFLPMLNNYLFAHEAAMQTDKTAEVPPLPCERSGEWHFPDAGLHVLSTSRHFTVVGLSKGGVVKTFLHERDGQARLLVSDCGWWGSGSGGSISSQVLTRPPDATNAGGGSFEVRCGFVKVN